MFKKFGLTFGGLHQKILNLVLVFILAIVAVVIAVALYQSNRLSKIVEKTTKEQQAVITDVSEETMKAVVESTMYRSAALEAYMASDVFDDVSESVTILQTLAQGLSDHRDQFLDGEVTVPDAKNEGKPAVQFLFEEGVTKEEAGLCGLFANMADTLKAVYSGSDHLNSCFVGTADGTFIIADDRSAEKFDDKGKIKSFPVRDRFWYTQAEKEGKLVFTGVEYDAFTGQLGLVCAAPVYSKGDLVAVVGVDLFLTSMDSYVKSVSTNDSYTYILNAEGKVVVSPDEEGIFAVDISAEAKDLRQSDNEKLASLITKAYTERTEVDLVTISGKEYYICGAPVADVGWTVLKTQGKATTDAPKEAILAGYNKSSDEAADSYQEGLEHTRQVILVMVLLILVLSSVSALYAATRVVKPVEKMTSRIYELTGTDQLFEMEPVYKTGDEIEALAEAFADVSRKTRQYIEEITNITREKERIGTELELARRIQANMLPNLFPAFPDRAEFDIYASMTPAKEVGGDFYDFFLIDKDHLAMVMADVSGKGVPAALFMMMSKILVNNYASMPSLDYSPAKVLTQLNQTICKNNEEEMFVTVWLGIMEISTGKVIAANAGHEYPIIGKADGTYELMKDVHGFVIGGMETSAYREYEFTLEKGGSLFLYTDGISEATDANEQMYGTDRLLACLNAHTANDPKSVLDNVIGNIHAFVGDAPQFDDMTLLCVTLKGNGERKG